MAVSICKFPVFVAVLVLAIAFPAVTAARSLIDADAATYTVSSSNDLPDSMQLIGTCDTPTALNYNIYTLISAGKFIGLGSNYPSFLNFPQPDGNVNSLRIKSLLDVNSFQNNNNLVASSSSFIDAGGLSFVDTKDTWYNLRQSRNGLMTMSMSELRGTAPMRIFSWSPVPSINPLGCYKDYKVSSTEAGPAGNDDWTQHAWPLRDFPNARVDAAMTTETCAQIASENGSQYFGTQEGQECWFGASITEDAAKMLGESTECNVPCLGNKKQMCGGSSGAISLYERTSAYLPGTR